MGDGGGVRVRVRVSSLPFSLPPFPFSPETPDTQANICFTFIISANY